MRSFSTLQLLDSAVEVVEALRNPMNHRGELRPHLTDCADREYARLWQVAELLDLDPTGLPAWRVNGDVRGLSTRTRTIHLVWLVEDIRNRLPVDDSEVWRVLWDARSRSIGCSPEAASIMLAIREEAMEDQFAIVREGDAIHAS